MQNDQRNYWNVFKGILAGDSLKKAMEKKQRFPTFSGFGGFCPGGATAANLLVGLDA